MEFELRHSNSSSIHTAHHDGSHMTASGQRHLDDAVEEYNHDHDYTRNHNDNVNINTNNQQPQLPPRDGGRDAWLFLGACFMIEALVWGFAFAFGIFQDYYSTHEPFKQSGNIAAIGTCAMGIIYILSPFVFGLLLAVPRLKRFATPLGFLIMCVALALSSFATNTTHLLLTQGIGYGVGASLAYAPTILFMEEWFVNKRGLAFGIMWAGTGVSGVVLPVFLQWLLNAHGFRTTLRVWSVVLFILTAPLLYFVKPRLPIAQSASMRPFDFSFLWNRTFLIFQLGNVLEALGFFLPSIYLPTYASRTLGASNLVASLTVILVNLASVFGCIIMGMLVDRYHVTTCIFISTVGSTVAIFLLWGFSLTLAPLFIFCIAYGIFAGPFSATWPAIMKEVQKNANSAEPTIVFAFLAAGRGIGNVVSGPLSEKLLQGFPWRDAAGGAYGSGYGTLIVFTGITAFLGGLSVLARPLRLL
ncbi:hypothetical protein VTN77DRAFT_9899 [Rasamsonia byssochlamydoides]|uniref:uncharacterized protein n=1 Tax=Rasamsonia byssochlamydoides TaxID=89139 RepID=UPI003743883C